MTERPPLDLMKALAECLATPLRPVDRVPPRFYRYVTAKEVCELKWNEQVCLWDGLYLIKGNVRSEPNYASETVLVELRSKAIVQLVIVDVRTSPNGSVFSDDREFVTVVYDAPRENEGDEFDY